MRLSRYIPIVLFCFLAIVCLSQGKRLSVLKCRELGFDTYNLACSTCNLLPSEEHKANCKACCESFRDLSTIQKPYEAAVLVVPGQSRVSEELQKLLQEDWDDIVESKGKSRLRLVEKSSGSQALFFSAPPIFLHLYADAKKTSTLTSISQLEATAQESIVLNGWKREDIRDMLQALLPSLEWSRR